MKWKIVWTALAGALLACATHARAESVSLAAGTATTLSYTVTGREVDIYLPQVAAVGPVFLELNGLRGNVNYLFHTHLTNATGTTLDFVAAEVLNKAGVGDDTHDTGGHPAWMPAGYSGSNTIDGFSFAQGAGAERSSSAFSDVFADEVTDARDFLRFSGGSVMAGGHSVLTFGIRDYNGQRPFLLALGLNGFNAAATPEPATVLLIGSGLLGFARAARRRRRA